MSYSLPQYISREVNMMAYDKNWEKFKKTGKIEDYLKFKKVM